MKSQIATSTKNAIIMIGPFITSLPASHYYGTSVLLAADCMIGDIDESDSSGKNWSRLPPASGATMNFLMFGRTSSIAFSITG